MEEQTMTEEDVSEDFDPEKWDTTPRPPSVTKKIVRLMEMVGAVPKDKSNDFHHYKYLSAAGLMSKVQPALIDLGLIARQTMHLSRDEWVDTGNKKQQMVVVRCILTVEDSETGEYVNVTSYGSGMDSGDKAIMKAQTAAHKSCWMYLLNLSTGDDPEADVSTDAATAGQVSQPKPLPSGDGPFKMKTPVIEVKKKTSNPNSPFLIVTPNGDFSTFNKDVATSAEVAKGVGAEIEFEYEVKTYKGIPENKIIDPKKG